MSRKMKFAVAFLACVSLSALAEKWKDVGTATSTQFGNANIYVDMDSASRSGDLAKIKFKSLDAPKVEEFNFDCKKNIIFSNSGEQFSTTNDLVGKGGTVTWPVSLLKNMQSAACKKSYEFWK
jgi:hypothetical protein